MVNKLLRRDKQTRGLRMRTYKVVPLSQRSGIVEWCTNTTSIGNYLVGTSPMVSHAADVRKKYTSFCLQGKTIRE